MSDNSCQNLIGRLNKLISLRKTVDEQWDLIRRYVTPYRGQFFKQQTFEHAVEWRENRFIYDSTAVNACNTLASSLHGALTSPAFKWFDFRFREARLNKDKEASEWLEKCSNKVYEALQDSNFNLEANETYLDLCSYGTSVIVEEVEERNGQFSEFIFQSVPIVECYFEQDHRGRVVRLYRKMQWSPLMIVEKFGAEQTPEKIRDRAEKGDAEKDIEIVFCVFERPDHQDIDTTRILSPKMRPFGSKYILYQSKEPIGEEGGYYEMPAFIPRWRKTADSMWGNSPAMAALADILTLNQLVELILASCEKVVDPAIITTERGLLSDLDLNAGGINIVRKIDELVPFESRARFDVSELQREKLQRSIQQAFYVDQLEMKDSPAMTATEVQVRYELMQRLLGPTLGRLSSDYLDPMVKLTFANLYRYKRLPKPPPVVANNPSAMDIVYTGPLSRSQRADQAGAVERMLGLVLPLSEINPEIIDTIDWDELVRIVHDSLQVPAGVLNSESQINQIREARAEQQQAMQEAELMEQAGKGAEAMGKGMQAVG